MPSKYSAWDFVKKLPNIIDMSEPGIYGFSFFDPFIQKIVIDKLPTELTMSEDFHVVHAVDLTVEWFENNFQTLSLFGTSDSYLVIESQSLSTNVKEYLEETSFDLTDRFLIFVSKNDAKGFPKLEKMTGGSFHQIDAPKFWEGANLLDFLSSEMKVELAYEVKGFLLKNLENNCFEFVNALNLIELHFDNGKTATLDKVKEVITSNKVDQFELAKLFCDKKRAMFYKSVLDHDLDFEGLRTLFSFMQGHLFKMLDPSYVQEKRKPSKYDKEIEAVSRSWNKSDVLEELRIFGELEVLAKSKSIKLKDELRLKCLSNLG